MTGTPPTGPIRGLLIDISGVVWQGDRPIGGAAEAIERLRAAGMPFRFLTNTTSRPRGAILSRFGRFGIAVGDGEVFTPALAARAYLAAHRLAAHFLVDPGLLEDFDAPVPVDPRGSAVVVGDAGPGFTHARLNDAFRRLTDGAELIALAANRMYLDEAGRPAMDVGAYVAALEYASGASARVLGKPAPEFFARAAGSMGLGLAEVAMIGDDAEFDVAAAMAAGARGYLVRTGKGAKAGPAAPEPAPTGCADDLLAAVETILGGATPP